MLRQVHSQHQSLLFPLAKETNATVHIKNMALTESYDFMFEFYFSLLPSDIWNQVSDEFNCKECLKYTTGIVETDDNDIETAHLWNFVYFTPVWQ